MKEACDRSVEQPKKFELFVNLKTAKALRVSVPRYSSDARGHRVTESVEDPTT